MSSPNPERVAKSPTSRDTYTNRPESPDSADYSEDNYTETFETIPNTSLVTESFFTSELIAERTRSKTKEVVYPNLFNLVDPSRKTKLKLPIHSTPKEGVNKNLWVDWESPIRESVTTVITTYFDSNSFCRTFHENTSSTLVYTSQTVRPFVSIPTYENLSSILVNPTSIIGDIHPSNIFTEQSTSKEINNVGKTPTPTFNTRKERFVLNPSFPPKQITFRRSLSPQKRPLKFPCNLFGNLQNPIIEMSVIHPELFSGRNQDGYNWMERYESLAIANGWVTNANKINHLRAYLEHPVLGWFTRQNYDPAVTQWAEVKDQFLRVYDPNYSSPLSLEIKLSSRVKTPDESFASYTQDMLQLINRTDPQMTEPKKLQLLLKGLPPVEKQLLILLQPADVDEFWDKLQVVTQSLGTVHNHVIAEEKKVSLVQKEDISVNRANEKTLEDMMKYFIGEITTLKDQMNKVLDRTAPRPYNQYNQNRVQSYPNRGQNLPGRTVDGKVICNYCRRPGHIERFCFSKNNTQNRGNNPNNANMNNNRNVNQNQNNSGN